MWWNKTKEIAFGLLTAIWALLMPIHGLIYCTVGITILDFITGIWRAIRAKEPITSHKMRLTVTAKLLPYLAALLVGFLMDSVIDPTALLCSRSIAILIVTVDGKSNLENLSEVVGFDLWQAVVDKLKPPTKE